MEYLRYVLRTMEWKFAAAALVMLLGVGAAVMYGNRPTASADKSVRPHKNDPAWAAEEKIRIQQVNNRR